MEHLVAIMLLVGCNTDGSTCTEIPVPTPAYSSLADCENDLALQMRLTQTFDNRVLGGCKAVDEALLEEEATIDWAVNRAGNLLIEIEASAPTVVAASPSEPQQIASR